MDTVVSEGFYLNLARNVVLPIFVLTVMTAISFYFFSMTSKMTLICPLWLSCSSIWHRRWLSCLSLLILRVMHF